MKNKLLLCSLALAGMQAMSKLSAQCQADFTFTVNNNVVTFTNTSIVVGTPSTFWEFGDLNTDWTTNPVHTYANAGTYYVCLTLVDSSTVTPCQSTYCDTIQILSLDSCNANFTYSVSGNTVTFTDQSSPNAIVWSWYFGDGSMFNGQNAVHTYAQPGTYLVCHGVMVGNTWADSCGVCDTIIVGGSPAPCNANFTYSTTGNTVTFTDKSSPAPVSWQWYFGDGATSLLQNPIHTYSQSGWYSPSLHIQMADSTSCYHSDTIQVPANSSCNANFSYSVSGNTVAFTDQSSPAPIGSYWNFGDGGASTQQNPVHTYAQSGTYWVCNTIWTQTDSCSQCYSVIITPSGIFEHNNTSISFMQNYPNPFSSTTTIEYTLEKSSNVKIMVYNALGDKVAELENADKSAGKHQLEWNAESLPAGIYHLQLSAGKSTQSRKLVLLK